MDDHKLGRKYLSPKTAFAATTVVALGLAVGALISSRSKTSAPPKQSPPPGRAAQAVSSDLQGPRSAAERERFGPPDDLPEGPPPDGADASGGRPFEEQPNGGEAGIPLPFGRLPRPIRSPLQEGTVQAMLAQADAYAAAHPQNFRDMIDRYRQVLSKARGTPEAADVNQKMDQVIDEHQAAIHKAIRDYELKMDALLQASKPQEAYDVWRDFPQNLRTVQSDQQISQLLQRKLGASFVPR